MGSKEELMWHEWELSGSASGLNGFAGLLRKRCGAIRHEAYALC